MCSKCAHGVLMAGPLGIIHGLHRVHKAGHIGWSDYVVGIDSRLAGQRVLVIALTCLNAPYRESHSTLVIASR